jgi:hypothetical protein
VPIVPAVSESVLRLEVLKQKLPDSGKVALARRVVSWVRRGASGGSFRRKSLIVTHKVRGTGNSRRGRRAADGPEDGDWEKKRHSQDRPQCEEGCRIQAHSAGQRHPRD